MEKLEFLRGHGDKSSDKIGWLESVLQVDFKLSPELMRVSLEGDRSDDMQKIIEAIRIAYMKNVVDRDKTHRLARFQQLEAVQRTYEEKLKKSRHQLKEFAGDLGSSIPENLAFKEKSLHEEYGMGQRELMQLESKIRLLKAEVSVSDSKVKSASTLTVPSERVDAQIKLEPAYLKLLARATSFRTSSMRPSWALTPGHVRQAWFSARTNSLRLTRNWLLMPTRRDRAHRRMSRKPSSGNTVERSQAPGTS